MVISLDHPSPVTLLLFPLKSPPYILTQSPLPHPQNPHKIGALYTLGHHQLINTIPPPLSSETP